MQYEFHDTALAEKRARTPFHAGRSNAHGERVRLHRENTAAAGQSRWHDRGCSFANSKLESSSSSPKPKAMSAGSSPDTRKSQASGFVITITEPPVVEIDTEATAACIRLREGQIARTEPSVRPLASSCSTSTLRATSSASKSWASTSTASASSSSSSRSRPPTKC